MKTAVASGGFLTHRVPNETVPGGVNRAVCGYFPGKYNRPDALGLQNPRHGWGHLGEGYRDCERCFAMAEEE